MTTGSSNPGAAYARIFGRRGVGVRRVCLLVIACGAFACATAPSELRKHTYPPEFRYLDRARVSDAMLGFTHDVERIDAILRTQPQPSEADRADILLRLARMEQVAAGLDGFHTSNRPLIDARMDGFRRDVGLARQAVEATPPSYFLAGSVAGSCLHCHGEPRP